MAYTIKVLLPLLCISTAIYSTRGSPPFFLYQATRAYNDSINRIFETVDSYAVHNFISTIANPNATDLEIPIIFEIGPFENKLYFTGINISILHFQSPRVQYDFSDNEITIFTPELSIRVEAYVGAIKEIAHAGFIRSMSFKNMSISATKPSDEGSDNKFQIGFTYDDLQHNHIYLPWFREDISSELQLQLNHKIEQLLPMVLLVNLKHNENFLQLLNRTFCMLTTKPKLSSFQFFYASDVSSFHITMSDIFLNGLKNFESLKWESTNLPEHPVYNLAIRNVRGIANIWYEIESKETNFKLVFDIDYLSILLDQRTQRVYVEARNYSVSEGYSNTTLTRDQSTWVMQGVGRAIATRMMPSMEVCDNREELSNTDSKVHPIVQLLSELSDKFHWTAINESYKNWTPFEGAYTATEISPHVDPSNGSVSIHNITITSIIPNRYPFQVECHFFDKLVLIYDITGNATGTVRLQNTIDEPVDVNFTARFSFSDQIIKRTQKGDYEYKLWLSYDFSSVSITLSPSNYTYHNGEQFKIKQQINTTLLSMTREIMLNNAKPLLSLPLDFCITPDKISEDFLPRFADYQKPYHIPNRETKGRKHFTQKIYNITLFGLSNFALARVSINKDDLPRQDYGIAVDDSDSSDDSEETFGTYVEFPIKNITGRMNFNDSSVKFRELRIERLNELMLLNATAAGRITVFPDMRYNIAPVPADDAFSCYDSMWIMEKLEDIIEHSLSRSNHDFLYSLY